jgi:hypothetical protein
LLLLLFVVCWVCSRKLSYRCSPSLILHPSPTVDLPMSSFPHSSSVTAHQKCNTRSICVRNPNHELCHCTDDVTQH